MKNTNVDLGDFNGDGYIDMLSSGQTASGDKVTKLMEYTPAAGFIESNFDLSDIVDARVEFGDLDGDEDLDFVIAGKKKIFYDLIILSTGSFSKLYSKIAIGRSIKKNYNELNMFSFTNFENA
mgnify:CR=1 FL=1